MTEYIDREEVLKIASNFAKPFIQKIPAADVRPVVHGKWETVYISEGGGRSTNFLHIQCGCEVEEESNYCPNCGARMDGR